MTSADVRWIHPDLSISIVQLLRSVKQFPQIP